MSDIVLFEEHAKYVANVLEALNKLPANDDFYLDIRLKDTAGTTVGEFSDEVSPNAWSFRSASPQEGTSS